MKRIIFIFSFMLAIFSTFTDANKVQAQSIAMEYIYDAWNQTGDGENTYWEPCDICGEFFGGHNEHELENNLELHKEMEHPIFPDEKGDYGEGSSSSGNTSGGGGTTQSNANCVSLNGVANGLQQIGVCRAQWFIDEYKTYYGLYSGSDVMVNVVIMNSLIINKFHPKTYKSVNIQSYDKLFLIYKMDLYPQYHVAVKNMVEQYIKYADSFYCYDFR